MKPKLTPELTKKIELAVQKTIGGGLDSGWGEPLKDIYEFQDYESDDDTIAYEQEYLEKLAKALCRGKVRIEE